ncbi:FtsB family cell division protein [Loigolactobacillus zhaoyuanensis]|uniref:Septum formation initiator family protein n=1 Tax=Loigolactobacillus zhaoyuanensis TaxID=2486017 RepID=A0ABW8UJ76_9LACO|nr:septum formation initiator family protein [Loigolactobacillus zhaoyuanensis]
MLLTKKKAKTNTNKQSAIDPYAQIAQARQQKQKRVHYVQRVHKRRIMLIVALLVGVFLVSGFQIYQAHRSLVTTTAQVTTKQTELKKTKAEQRQLKLQTEQLQNDDYLQQVIRQKYYYSKNNETIYSLPQDKAPTISTK